jgi:protein-S-isoprenylcysteine O-methyltransferase Ste14
VPSWSQVASRIRVPLGFTFAAAYVWLAHPTKTSLALGAAIALIGVVIRALASGHLEKNEALATAGPYRYTRNPLYLGSMVLALGFLVAARSWWIGLGALAMLVGIYLPVIGSEEAFLRSRFPEYEEYSRRVPRLLPRLRANPSSRGSFSWHLYWKHREYNAALGMLGMLAILIAKLVWFTN